ncbi:MAG: hypothetical protein JXQ73_09800, partial [Phycisphaerae bacterium]|nr:hypothetical protein [Phycisphaerae bacterium]
MRLAGVLGVLLFVAAPVMAGEIDYTFDVISGTLTVDTTPNDIAVPDPAIVNLGGTFMATFVTQSDGHIGESDTILLG